MVRLLDVSTGLVSLLTLGAILGAGLIGMALTASDRILIDRRGLFVGRGRRLDFMPAATLAEARAGYSRSMFGAFESGNVDGRAGGKRLRVGFNRVLGLGLPVRDIMAVLTER